MTLERRFGEKELELSPNGCIYYEWSNKSFIISPDHLHPAEEHLLSIDNKHVTLSKAYCEGFFTLIREKGQAQAATLVKHTCLFCEKIAILLASIARLPLISFPL
jgi:hypothetical protein